MIGLKNTGERMIPEIHKELNKYGAHLIRYQASLLFVKNKTVLDIACGTGYGSQLIAAEAKKVYSIDSSNESVSYAKKHYQAKNIEFLVGDCVDIPVADASVDVVVSYETIEHLADYKQFIKEVKRVLKSNGLLLLSSPNKELSIGGNSFHRKEFDYFELESLIKDSFKYQKFYFQTLWLYNSILPIAAQTKEWTQAVETTKTVGARQDEAEFFLVICSDAKITQDIKKLGVISEYHRQRKSLRRLITKLEEGLGTSNKRILRLDKVNTQKTLEIKLLRQRLNEIERSKAWGVARSLQRVSNLPRHLKRTTNSRPRSH